MSEIDTSKLRSYVRENIRLLCANFFPAGKEERNEYRIANTSGAEGNSLGIQLVGNKAGLWNDRATDEGGDFLKLLQINRETNFLGAVELIERGLGVSFAAKLNGKSHSHGSRGTIPKAGSGLNWDECVNALTDGHLSELQERRGLAGGFWREIRDQKKIGLFKGSFAFPVENKTGEVVACHYLRDPKNKMWAYAPKGTENSCLFIGDRKNAAKIHVFESQWDQLALCENTGAHLTDGFLTVSTRGASNAKLLADVVTANADVYLWPQNDQAGEAWLDRIPRSAKAPLRVVRIPKFFKDLNEWTRAGGSTNDLLCAIDQAAALPADPLAEASSILPGWLDSLKAAACSSQDLRKLSIEPRKAILGDWFKCGDLGFIFAPRGIGKSWIGLTLARGIAAGQNVGPWQTHEALDVVYFDGEMPLDDIRNRDAALGDSCPRLTFLNHELLFNRTARTLNLADPELQRAITQFCVERGYRLLFLDNLSTLASGLDENKGADWEALQPWLLDLRRRGISVVFIHHSGRNREMRGHSKREDPAFWIIRLDAVNSIENEPGAKFVSRFVKNRNATSQPKPFEWHYTPSGENKVLVSFKESDLLHIFRQQIEEGITSATEIAAELGITKGYVSKLARKGQQVGWLEINGGQYHLKTGNEKGG